MVSRPGEFVDGTIGIWRDDALAAVDSCASGQQILVGSSMGGWIMLLVALARPERVAGLIGIAAAPDFTEDLIWSGLDEAARQKLVCNGVLWESTDEGTRPITMKLVEEGRRHLLLRRPIAIRSPVRLLHGMRDEEVPWMTACRIAESIESPDTRVHLVKDGDHRLSREQDLAHLRTVVEELVARDQ